ncbi:Prefoldin subunit 1 [Colletotrichum sp. SAR11_59]|nr:Prefoldin subunit 1 [Colletotrichum sp. SAR11_240]KAI8298406.1 Prefoldin subunit 1 [Colletotrichum sp. SAR11_59]
MSIPNQALEKLIREIESQAIAAQQQIGQARTQMTAKQREMRMIKEKEGEVEKLGQKLHYLETTFKNSRQHIDQMLKAQS